MKKDENVYHLWRTCEKKLWRKKPIGYRESVAGSVIQTIGTEEFEDGLWIENNLKAWKVPGADWIPICLGLCVCLVSSQVLGSILGSHSVRIDLA